ncbi:hypothetical protein [Campylobacter majalis]|uniref:hypothetical protein n=1 Tax=Campylobacter majalis TaxID=2790656 RepID=UPI003D683804
MQKTLFKRVKVAKYRYIYGSKARFWDKFYYKNVDGFIVSRVGNEVVDVGAQDECSKTSVKDN